MGWQLIYTSASRLLEAGRSGFGTVARHREIPPLLAAAIERTSQFNRGPGLDESRIIYSHRHVTVSGSRYSVLSRIRSAGSDYTGRTNHIAHHLVFEAREIAAQGRETASPVDVMLSAPWLDRWEEQPRYLGVADELPLAGFNQRMELPAQSWENLTGNSRSAALLATADAIRGAYLVWKNLDDQQPEWPLYLLGESLLLLPDRRWSISFTSNLQPSDEAADFQWRCLPSGSPLRAQAEQSGRPLFDLNGTLPSVNGELAQLAESGSIAKRRVARQPGVVGNGQETRSPAFTLVDSPSPVVSALPAKATSRNTFQKRTTPYWIRTTSQRRRTALEWIGIGVAAAGILLLVGFSIWKFKQSQRVAEERQMQSTMIATKLVSQDQALQFLDDNKTASMKSLQETVERFARLASERKQGHTVTQEDISSLFMGADDISIRSEMRKWIEPPEVPLSSPSPTPEADQTKGTLDFASFEKAPVQPKPEKIYPTPGPVETTPTPPFLHNSPAVPTYFVVGNSGLESQYFSEVDISKLDLVLTSTSDFPPLARHVPGNPREFYLGMRAQDPAFTIPDTTRIVPTDYAPSPPYTLTGQNGGVPRIDIKVLAAVTETTPPLLGAPLSSGLILNDPDGQVTLTLDNRFDDLRRNLPQQDSVMIEVPDGFFPVNSKKCLLPFPRFALSIDDELLSDHYASTKRDLGTWQVRLKKTQSDERSLSTQLQLLNKGPVQQGQTLASQLLSGMTLSVNAKGRLAAANVSDQGQIVGVLHAVGTDLKEYTEEVYNYGNDIQNVAPDPEQVARECFTVTGQLEDLAKPVAGDDSGHQSDRAVLQKLLTNWENARPLDFLPQRDAREIQRQLYSDEQLESELKGYILQYQTHPLVKNQVPPGPYCLLLKTDEGMIPLLEVDIAAQSP